MRPTGCIRCGAAGSHVLHPLELVACIDCYLLWIRDESLSVDSVVKATGAFDIYKPELASTRRYGKHMRAFDAELLKRTTAWAAKARAAA